MSSPAASSVTKRLLLQIDFYFSDINLAHDEFFKAQLAADDGWVAVDLLLKCNRVKSLTSSADVVKAAVAESKAVVLNEAGDKVKRVVPYVAPTEPLASDYDRCVIVVTNHPLGVRWNALKDTFDEVCNVAFSRVKAIPAAGIAGKNKRKRDDDESTPATAGGAGGSSALAVSPGAYVVVNCTGRAPAEVLASLQAENLSMSGQLLKLSLLEGDAAKAFWEESKAEKESKKAAQAAKPIKAAQQPKPAKRAAPGAKAPKSDTEFKFTTGKTFKGFDAVATYFRGLIKDTPVGTSLAGSAVEDLKQALAFHPHAADKLKDAVSFTVGKHPEFPETTCFMAVAADGNKIDFSWKKSVEAWEASLAAPKTAEPAAAAAAALAPAPEVPVPATE